MRNCPTCLALVTQMIWLSGCLIAQDIQPTVAIERAVDSIRQGKWEEAELQLRKVLPLVYEQSGTHSRDEALACRQLAYLCRYTNRWEEAAELYQRALKIYGSIDNSSQEQVEVSMELAESFVETSRFKEAGEIYSHRWDNAPELAQLEWLISQAHFYSQVDRLAEAKQSFELALVRHEEVFARTESRKAYFYVKLGTHLMQASQYARAETYLADAITILHKHHLQATPEAASAYAKLGKLYQLQGKYELSAGNLLRAQNILNALIPKLFQPSLAHTLVARDHALLLINNEWYDDAKRRLREVLQRQRELLGPEHPETAQTLAELGLVHAKLSDLEAADYCLQAAVTLVNQQGAVPFSHQVSALQTLPLLLLQHGNDQQAEALQQSICKLLQRILPESHPALIEAASSLGVIQRERQNLAASLDSFEWARRISFNHITATLPWMSDVEQMNYLDVADRSHLHEALNWATLSPTNQQVVQRTLEWVINSKAAAEWAQSQLNQVTRYSLVGEADALRKELISTTAELSRLSLENLFNRNADGQTVQHHQLRALEHRTHALTIKFQASVSNLQLSRRWITSQDLMDQLPENAAYIELVRLSLNNVGQERRFGEEYLAWLVTSNSIEIVSLGSAHSLEQHIEELRKMIGQASEKDDQQKAERDYWLAQAALRDQLLLPIMQLARDKARWIIAPDGATWLVPWQALALEDNTYLVEHHTVQLVTSASRLLSASTEPIVATSAPVIISDPDFRSAQPGGADTKRSALADFNFSNLEPLPGTATEALMFAQAFKDIYKEQPVEFSGANATAEKLMKLRRPLAISIGTHGFHVPARKAAQNYSGVYQSATENPMLRCGLCLAGSSVPGPLGLKGVVTGKDIMNLDLRGCQLVILSCCETAVGDIQLGDGVASLRRAFQIAGARTVVASLWEIADKANVDFMDAFVRQMKHHPNKADALAAAQRERLARLRSEGRATHPYYWAAFVITGDGI